MTDETRKFRLAGAQPPEAEQVQNEPVADEEVSTPEALSLQDPLAKRLAEVRARARAYAVKAVALIDEAYSGVSSSPNVDPDTIIARLSSATASGEEQTHQNLSEFVSLLSETTKILEYLWDEIWSLIGQIDKKNLLSDAIDKKIHQLDQTKGFDKLSAWINKRQLVIQKTLLVKQKEIFQRRLENKKLSMAQIVEHQYKVDFKKNRLIEKEVSNVIRDIHDEYKLFLDELVQDGRATRQICEAFVETVINPKVEGLSEYRKMTDEQKNSFYSILKKFIDNRGESEERIQDIRIELNSFLNSTRTGGGLSDAESITNGGDTDMLSRVIANMAVDEIRPIDEALFKKHRPSLKIDKFALYYYALPSSASNDGVNRNFTKNFRNKLHGHNEGISYKDMLWWNAMKMAKVPRELLGENIHQQDLELYEQTLDGSLVDMTGKDICRLFYYPTPEAIRNLVVLAAGDLQTFRTSNVNATLTDLRARPEWNALLEKAIETYPSLEEARSTLEEWNFYGTSNHPDIQKVSRTLNLQLTEDSDVDPRLAELALRSLRTEDIIIYFARRNVLNEQEQSKLLQAIVALETAGEELAQQANGNDDVSLSPTDKFFNSELRDSLLSTLSPTGQIDLDNLQFLQKFVQASDFISANQTNYEALAFVNNYEVAKRIADKSRSIDDINTFLGAYKQVPAFMKNQHLLELFCQQYSGEQTVSFFSSISSVYREHDRQLNSIIYLVGRNQISKERAMEIPSLLNSIFFDSTFFNIAITYPKIFLSTDDGIRCLNHLRNGTFFSMDSQLDASFSESLKVLQNEEPLSPQRLYRDLLKVVLESVDEALSSDQLSETENQLGWQGLLLGYARTVSEVFNPPNLSPKSIESLRVLFEDSKVKDLCLNGLRDQWIAYLRSGKPGETPFTLSMVSTALLEFGGAGPLSQIESLNKLILSVEGAFARETTRPRTKSEISSGLVGMDEKFRDENWSSGEKTDFYNISRDIIAAAPSIFTDFLNVFETLSPSDLQKFAKELYPLYRTKLVLLEKTAEHGAKSFDVRQLAAISSDLRKLGAKFKSGASAFEDQKNKLLDDIKVLFKDRLGLIKIPDEFSSEHLRTLKNGLTYLANLNDRTTEKELILGYYVSLMMNNQWDDYRSGLQVDPSELLTPEKALALKTFLNNRQKLDPLTPENLGLAAEDLPAFIKLLQKESTAVITGDIETIDVKLSNIILNLQGLVDVDLYTDPLDKKRMRLLLQYGNKRVGLVVSSMYQEAKNQSGASRISQEDREIQDRISTIMNEENIPISADTIKKHFQDAIRPLSTVVNLMTFINETKAEVEILVLKELLHPSTRVIEIFKRLGEDFEPTSGARALSQDLSYLDNLIVKREDELTAEEISILTEYTSQIRQMVISLENIYAQLKNKFVGLKQASPTTNNPLLEDKMVQINKIINTQASQQVVTSTITNNLNTVIENIRECLSCTREGCNNDTNLTLGDTNKFYLFSQSETQKIGSISDELVFLEPITLADGSQSVAFVLDRIYGSCTPVVLENHIDVVLKKLKLIKSSYPDSKLSVFVTAAAIQTGGTDADLLLKLYKAKKIIGRKESANIDVAESATGDHYVEFGGEAREAGSRQVEGLYFE